MMKQTKKAFTLVELIIVITILAILATIGFMSYQSYTADARNSKRTNDLASIESKVVVVMAKTPSTVLTMINTWATSTWNMVADTFTAWNSGALIYWTTYKAWNIDYTNSALWINQESFSDPAYSSTSTWNYMLWIVTITTKGMLYQLAAKLESNGDDVTQSLVRWFYATGASSDANWLIKGTTSLSWIINKTTDLPY